MPTGSTASNPRAGAGNHSASDPGVRQIEFAGDSASSTGVVLIRALFPRSHVDPNRAEDDLDIAMLMGPWAGAANPGPKTELGVGLIPRREPGGWIHDRELHPEEVKHRIDAYWRPYH